MHGLLWLCRIQLPEKESHQLDALLVYISRIKCIKLHRIELLLDTRDAPRFVSCRSLPWVLAIVMPWIKVEAEYLAERLGGTGLGESWRVVSLHVTGCEERPSLVGWRSLLVNVCFLFSL